jgi:Hint domain
MTNSLTTSISTAITLTAGGADTSPFTVTSTGTINAATTAPTYGALTGIVLSTITNNGLINGGRYGVYLRDGGTLTNTGSINGGSWGVRTEDYSLVMRTSQPGTYIRESSGDISNIYNSGQITGGDYAVQLNFGGTVVNAAQGIIEGSAYGAGVSTRIQPGTIINAGSISALEDINIRNGGYFSNASTGVLTTNSPTYGLGVYLGGGNASMVNAGHIEAATTGVYVQYSATGVSIRNTGFIEGNTVAGYGGGPSGTASGGIYDAQETGVLSVYNAGTIASALGAGGDAISFSTLSYYVSAGVYKPRSAVLDLTIAPGAVFTGAVDAAASLTNHIELTSGSSTGTITGIGSQFNGFDSIGIDTGASWTLGGNSAGLLNGLKIDGITSRDTIDLTDTVATTDSFNSSTGVLTLFNAGNAEIGTLQLELNTLIAGTTFAVNSDEHGGTDITTNAICYLRGTSIVTAQGEMAVEDIKIGDLVATRSAGLRPVRWIGRQSFSNRFVRNNRSKIPVHIRPGALGAGLPARELFVSPGHSMLIGEVLILARQLVNGITITQDLAAVQAESIEYYQLEFDGHDCILAEGTWSESFADGPGLREQFHNIADYVAEHPDYVEPPQVALCAPRPEAGPLFEQALLPLLALAGEGLERGPLEGWIDDISNERIAGWAIDSAHPELPVQLLIWAGETLLGTVLACEHRGDLENAGKGSGRSGFHFTLPLALRDVAQAGLRVLRAGGTAALPLADNCRARLEQAA